MNLQAIAENLIQGKADKVKELVEKVLKEKEAPGKILNEGLLAGMSVVGDKFKKNEFYIPEVLIAARAMKMGMGVLKPHLVGKEAEGKGKVIIGTVQGDLHDIGKNLVGMMLEGAGFEIVDLGIDVSPDKFIEAAKKEKASLIGLSALLTTTMPGMKIIVQKVKEASLPNKVKVMVGGAPLTQEYTDEIGADGYAPDAASATDLATKLLEKG